MQIVCKFSLMIGVKIAAIHDTRRALKTGLFPVKLRTTYKRNRYYLSLDLSFNAEDWQKVNAKMARGKYKEDKLKIEKHERKAQKVIDEMKVFSFPEFKRRFYDEPSGTKDVMQYFNDYIDKLTENSQASTADTYNTAKHSLLKFMQVSSKKKSRIEFKDVNVEWLEAYERWMLKERKSRNTISIYVRCLRKIINQAINDGSFDSAEYPFGDGKYEVPASENVKRALTLDQVQKIYEYQPINKAEERAKDFWLFSYLCNGMNMKDIFNLKYRDIKNGSIVFIRTKTSRTKKKKLRPVEVIITTEINTILEKWGDKLTKPDSHIFGVLDGSETPERQLAKCKQALKVVNKYCKLIGEKLELPISLTTYVARHSYATVMKRSGTSLEYISESLGHSNLATTENYLKSFEKDEKLKQQSKLTAFNK